MDSIVNLLKSKFIEYQSLGLSKSDAKSILLTENNEILSIEVEICNHFEKLMGVLRIYESNTEEKPDISNYQNIVQCIYYLVSKVITTFHLTITDDIISKLSDASMEFTLFFFNNLKLKLEICRYALHVISILANSDSQKFMSAWPFFLTDNFVIDTLIISSSQRVIDIFQSFDNLTITSSHNNANNRFSEIQNLSTDIESIPAQSFIIQMLYLTPFRNNSNSQIFNELRTSSKFSEDFMEIAPIYNELNKSAVVCIERIFQGIQIHKWFQQQLFHSISTSSTSSNNTTNTINQNKFNTPDQTNNNSITKQSIIGIIGQNRNKESSMKSKSSLSSKSNNLSSLESKVSSFIIIIAT